MAIAGGGVALYFALPALLAFVTGMVALVGQTIVLVTHDESLALRADRRIVMSDGLILPE
jgi:predicted ABC-type transport system involved in lysophospholipase L1 biosynthesis ATPase subunit